MIDLLSGQDFEPSQYNDEGNGIPYMTGASCVIDGETFVNRWTAYPKCIASKGDVLLVCKGSGYGTLARLSQEKAHIARQFMDLQCTDELDQNFNYYLANSVVDEIKRDARGLIAGIDRAAILNQNVFIPQIEEQRKIGVFFMSLDKTITLHQRKLKKWTQAQKTIKTASWEQRKLGNYASYRRGSFPQPYGKPEWYDGEGAKPFVQVIDVKDDMRLADNTKQKISKLAQPMSVYAEKGQVLVTLQGSIGRVAVAQYGAFVDRTVLIFEKYKEPTDTYFWANVIKNKFAEEARKAPGGTIKTITKEALSDFDVMVPSFLEQQKIGAFFSTLDHLITLHQRKGNILQKAMKLE